MEPAYPRLVAYPIGQRVTRTLCLLERPCEEGSIVIVVMEWDTTRKDDPVSANHVILKYSLTFRFAFVA